MFYSRLGNDLTLNSESIIPQSIAWTISLTSYIVPAHSKQCYCPPKHRFMIIGRVSITAYVDVRKMLYNSIIIIIHVCVRACVRACARARVRVCARACVYACACVSPCVHARALTYL